MNEQMPKTISKNTAKVLKDVTGEPRLEIAMKTALKDSLKYKLEEINSEIKEFREKYEMDFEEFKKAWEKGEIKEKYSYPVESDYWKWEELSTRKQEIKKTLDWFK